MSGLLETKLHRPTPLPKAVPRPRLIQRLNDGLASGRRLTLVSAPAGFGKTACLSQWLDTLDLPVAWLSLDPADDDPGRFFTYLIAALQKVHPGLARDIEGVLRSGQLPPVELISTTLINDILQVPQRFMLVLDDFQVLQDRLILQVIEKLVTNLPAAAAPGAAHPRRPLLAVSPAARQQPAHRASPGRPALYRRRSRLLPE